MFEALGKHLSSGFETLGNHLKSGWETLGKHINNANNVISHIATVAKPIASALGFNDMEGLANDVLDFTQDVSLNLQQADETINRLEKKTKHTSSQIKEKTSTATKHYNKFRKHIGGK